MPYLIYAPDTDQQKVYHLTLSKNTIGRSLDNSIVIMDEGISRRHAVIEFDGRWLISDLRSLNHTFVNGIEITQKQLQHGDLICLGHIKFQFVEQIVSSPREVEVKIFTNIPQVEVTEETSDDAGLNTTPSLIKQFTSEETQLSLQELVNSEETGVSVLKIRNLETTSRDLDKLRILLEVSKQLSSPEKPENLLGKILDLIFQIFSIDRAAILLFNEKTRKLEGKAVKLRDGVKSTDKIYSTKIINWVLQQGKAILTADALSDARFERSQSILSQNIHASICVPLKPRDIVIGVLYVDNLSRSHLYSDEDVEFLTAIGNQAAIAIDHAKLYDKIQQEALMRTRLERFFPQSVTKKLRETEQIEIIDTEVTALFADISDFTRISSMMQPRQVITMLNEYFEVMVEEIVFRYEGTLEKYIGDALFAVWGAPYQTPTDAERAIKSAIEMQLAVQKLNRKWAAEGKPAIAIHIGLNTGKVAAGNIGSEKLIQYATIGDTTNVTSRICDLAQAEEIIISQATFDKIKHLNLPVFKMPLVRVKGKEEPLQLYRVLWQQQYKLETNPAFSCD